MTDFVRPGHLLVTNRTVLGLTSLIPGGTYVRLSPNAFVLVLDLAASGSWLEVLNDQGHCFLSKMIVMNHCSRVQVGVAEDKP